MSSPVSIFEAISNSIQGGRRLKQGQQELGQRQQRIDIEKDQEARIAAQSQWENVQHAIENGGKVLGPGDLIREDHPMPDLSMIGGTNEGMPSHVPIYRPVDSEQEFVASYPGAKGTQPIKIAHALPGSQKSEKFMQAIADAKARVANSQLAPTKIAEANAETAAAPAISQGQNALRQAQLRTSGIAVPDDVADTIGYPRGTKVLPGEMIGAREAADKIKKERLLTTRPGEVVRDINKMPAAGGTPNAAGAPAADPSVVASGGPPLPTDDFGKYFLPSEAKRLNKTVPDPNGQRKATDMSPEEVQDSFRKFATSKKDPEMLDLGKQIAQLRIDALRQQSGNNPVPVKPGTPEFRVAQDLAYGKITMGQFRSLYGYSRNVGQKLGIYDKAAELNPNFNPAGFEMGFKFAENPKVQQQLSSLDNVIQAVPDMLKASDAASRTGVKKINQYLTAAGVQLGDKKYSNLNTARMAFADELSGALGYGSATDMSREMGLSMTDKDLSPEAFKSAINDVVVPFINRKRDTILKQMGPYGVPGMNPAADRAKEQAAPKLPQGAGKVIDKETANKFYEAAGKDPAKARALAEENGWKLK